MNVVRSDVEQLVKKELESANKRFPAFRSPHEGWAVIREEYDELKNAIYVLKGSMKFLWMGVKKNWYAGEDDVDGLAKLIPSQIREEAIDAACEAIQVAAMAQKYIEMLDGQEILRLAAQLRERDKA